MERAWEGGLNTTSHKTLICAGLQKEHRLSFCINLEVVIFQDIEFDLFLEEVLEPQFAFEIY